MNEWRCIKCGRAWSDEQPPIECECGCRIIRACDEVRGSEQSIQGDCTAKKWWIGLGGALLLVGLILGGFALEHVRKTNRIRFEAAAELAEKKRIADEVSRVASAAREEAAARADAERKAAEVAEKRRVADESARREAVARAEAEARAELARNPPMGYRFEDGSLIWSPGQRHPQYEHVFASKVEKQWDKEEGYVWVDPGGKSLEVRWEPGMKLSSTRRTGEREGQIEVFRSCSRCSGCGEITKTVSTHCPECNGSGKVVCMYKVANGGVCRKICDLCNGNKGYWSFGVFCACWKCFGTGVLTCRSCGGTEETVCARCWGSGGWKKEQKAEPCPSCDGLRGRWSVQ